MTISRLSVGGFKNLKRTDLQLDKIVAVVSTNNYGKSNLLEALLFANDFITASSKNRKAMMGWAKGIPLTKATESNEFFFEMEFYDPSLGDYSHVKYGFTFSWYKDDRTGQRITNEWIDLRSDESKRFASYLKRTEGKYRKGCSTEAWRKLIFDDSQLAIDVLASVGDLEYAPVIQAIRGYEYRVCSSLDLTTRFQAPPIEAINDNDKNSAIAFDDDDVPRALYILKDHYPKKYELFKESVFNLFPDFYKIDVQAYELKKDPSLVKMVITDNTGKEESFDESNIPFHIRDEMYRLIIYSKTLNQPINIALMSTGTKRIFWLLANVFIASCAHVSCIGIEELESSIHPRLLKRLLEVLNDALDDTKLIISSHSPYLIQYLNIEHIFVGVPSCNGVAEFKKVLHSKSRILYASAHDYGISVGEYLFELMSGDDDSSTVLNNYLGGCSSGR